MGPNTSKNLFIILSLNRFIIFEFKGIQSQRLFNSNSKTVLYSLQKYLKEIESS